jgi:hypothetical protein
MSMKIPLTPAGIEPATFRFVAKQLNHCATAVPLCIYIRNRKLNKYSVQLPYCSNAYDITTTKQEQRTRSINMIFLKKYISVSSVADHLECRATAVLL